MTSNTVDSHQLESHLWEAANILRGPVDAADFKTYVFPLLFFKRISDVYDEEYQAALDEYEGDEEAALLASIALAVLSPWLVRSLVWTGNPLYPYFFRSGDLGEAYDWAYDLATKGTWGVTKCKSLSKFLLLPWDLTFHADNFGPTHYSLGPFSLALIPLLLFVRQRDRTLWFLLLYVAGFVGIWFVLVDLMHYLFPVLPILSILTGFAFHTVARRDNFLRSFLLWGILVMALFTMLVSAKANIHQIPVVIGLESREHYLERLFPRYPVEVYINTQLPAFSKLLLPYTMAKGYYIDREWVFGDPRTTSPIDYRECNSAEEAARILTQVGITYLLASDDLPLLDGVPTEVQE